MKLNLISKLKRVGGFAKRHKKIVATAVAGAGAASAYALGIVTPDMLQTALQTGLTLASDHPAEAGATAGFAGGLVAYRVGSKARGIYRTLKSVGGKANPKAVAEAVHARLKGKSTGSEGGEQPSAEQPKIDWKKTRWAITET